MSRLAVACVLSGALFAAPATAAKIEVTARLEPDRIGIDEIAVLTIEARSGGMSGLSAQPHFNLENLEIAGGPSRSESFRWVNGATSRSLVMVWQLRPKAVGAARVHGLSVQVESELHPLADQTLTVQQEPTGAGTAARPASPLTGLPDPFEDFFGRPRRAPRASEPKLFLRAVATPEHAWVGQQITYTVYLYTQGDVSSVNPRALPAFRGFWVRELELPQRLRADMVEEQGERYGRVALLQRALFPLAEGTPTIEPIDIDIGVRVVEMTAFGPMTSSVVEQHRRTNAVELQIDPLPPAPAGFQGAVGKLSLQARLDREQVLAGDAATLTLTLTGEGHLQGLQDPTLRLPDGLRHFPPQKDASEQISGSTVGGRRTWSYVLVPERAGDVEIPAITLPYFDPASGSYQTASTPALVLHATPLATVAEPLATPPVEAPAEPPGRRLDWRLLGGWGLAAAGGIALTLATVRWRKRSPTSERGVRRSAEARLRLAADEERPRQAAAVIEDAWRDYLAARFELAPGTPSPQWPDELARRGVEPKAAADLKRLADDLHYLRYAPQLASADHLRGELITRSRRLLRALRRARAGQNL